MDQNNTLFGEISRIIGKINNDWQRLAAGEQPVSAIEKDILLSDLRSVYGLISEIEVAVSSFSVKTGPVDIPFEVFADEEPTKNAVPEPQEKEPVLPSEKVISVYPPTASQDDEKPQIEESKGLFDAKTSPAAAFEKEPEFNTPASEIKPPTNELPLKESKPETPRTEQKPASSQPKMMIDLFTPQKTVSDVLHGNSDKTVATKIQNNHISDIRSAIGINDKFTFVNDIFKGEISRYNQAIDHFNILDTLEDAGEYISRQGLRSGTPENLAALSKLMDLLKRKYQR